MKLKITSKYSLILLLPMLAAATLLAVFYSFMDQTNANVPYTNIAGRQRLLSEQLHNYAYMVHIGQEEDRKSLKALIVRFSSSLDALQFGGHLTESNITLRPPPFEIAPFLIEFRRIWLPLRQNLMQIASLPATDSEARLAYAKVNAGIEELTVAANSVVDAYGVRTAALNLHMRDILFANAAFTLFLLALGFWAARRYIVNPVRQLTDVASAIHAGDYAQRIKVSSQDELGELADIVNSMAGSIESSLQNERESRQQLEKSNRNLRSHEVELELLNEELSSANSAKSQFLANTSHELRTPLNAIIGFSDLLANPRIGELSDKQRRYVNHVHVSGNRLLIIINDLLDISKIEAGMMVIDEVATVPSRVVEQVMHELDPLASEKQIGLSFEQNSPDESLLLDAGKLHQMLVNVVGNAIKFTPEQGEICIHLTITRAKPEEHRIMIDVRDTGCGIAEQDQEKIFEPFVQAKGGLDRAFGGTGLGLALTRKQINLLGGEIRVQSSLGAGSCFTLELSAKPEPVDSEVIKGEEQQVEEASLGEKEISEVVPATGPKPRILIVDADTSRAEAVESLMQQQGYEAACSDISQAFRLAEQFCPFLIVLGVVAEDESSHSHLQKLKSNRETQHVPVILVGGDVNNFEFSMAPVGVVEKGVKQEELLDLIARHNRYIPAQPSIPTVLVIDDEQSVRQFLTEILVVEGYRVLLARGGEEGIRMAIEREPDMIILDVMMPNVTGFDVLKQLSRHPVASDIPVVVYTAKDLSREEALHFGREAERILIKGSTGRSELLRQLHKLELLYPSKAHLMDTMLHCYNLRYIQRRMDQEISRSKRFATKFSLICWQVDDYDEYIGSYGERWGIAALKTMLETVEDVTRRGDVCARMVDAQFVLFLPGVTPAGAIRVAEKMRIRFKRQRHHLPGDEIGKVTASFAAAHYPQDEDDTKGLLQTLTDRVAEAVKAGGDQGMFGDM